MNESRKRWLPLAMILLTGILAIVRVQRQHITTKPSPQALLSAAADAQHELVRIPTHFDPMSDADEIALGNTLAANYSTELDTMKDSARNKAIEQYLRTVGLRAATHTRRTLPWRFHYIPDDHFINAFALPGGHVFVGAGLLTLMHSEDALAAVLGHEIEHIDLRHCADRYQTEAHLRHLDPTGGLLSLPVDIFMAGYSKDQELEADRDGTTLAVEAGYSPQGILQLFAEFARLERTDVASPTIPLTRQPTFHLLLWAATSEATHPSPKEPSRSHISLSPTTGRALRWLRCDYSLRLDTRLTTPLRLRLARDGHVAWDRMSEGSEKVYESWIVSPMAFASAWV